MLLNVCTTSAAVSSWPSWNRTPLRSAITYVVGSGCRQLAPRGPLGRDSKAVVEREQAVEDQLVNLLRRVVEADARVEVVRAAGDGDDDDVGVGDRPIDARAGQRGEDDERAASLLGFLLEPGEQRERLERRHAVDVERRQLPRGTDRRPAARPGTARAAAAARSACRSPTGGRRASARRVRARRGSRARDR